MEHTNRTRQSFWSFFKRRVSIALPALAILIWSATSIQLSSQPTAHTAQSHPSVTLAVTDPTTTVITRQADATTASVPVQSQSTSTTANDTVTVTTQQYIVSSTTTDTAAAPAPPTPVPMPATDCSAASCPPSSAPAPIDSCSCGSARQRLHITCPETCAE